MLGGVPMSSCRCGRQMVEITMATPGAAVGLFWCGACDRVEWTVEGRAVERMDALQQLATTGRRPAT